MYGPRTARMLARKCAYMLAGGQKADSLFGTLRCAHSQRCNSKSTQSSKSLQSKFTTSCFQTAGKQHHLTRAPKSLQTWCEGTDNKSGVHQLQRWQSWVTTTIALTAKPTKVPTHNTKDKRVPTQAVTTTNRSCFSAKWALVT